jgi:arsenate reductase
LEIRVLKKEDFPSITHIYREGMATGIATFETEVPSWEQWDAKFLPDCRFVALIDNEIAGWCTLSAVSKRKVYAGVAENTVYVSGKFQKRGIGKALLIHLISSSESKGFWTLQASIFPQNTASIVIHQQCGFRMIGIREKIAQRDGIWHDNIMMERRSNIISKEHKPMKNILVLCTGNSCRSQMAHGYLNQFSNGVAKVYSAGIETHGLNPGAVAIMKEDEIDISSHTSNHVDEYNGIDWDYIITVCDHAYENCPFIAAPNAKRLHQNFFDPSKVNGSSDENHAAFLKARNEIKFYCSEFINSLS